MNVIILIEIFVCHPNAIISRLHIFIHLANTIDNE